MFSIDFLHKIRNHELKVFEDQLPPGSKILELGGGTGFQARRLTDKGYDIVSVDLPQSIYSEHREFPVLDFDGVSLPFSDDSFDVVISSNVLEHVKNFPDLSIEVKRVLNQDGFCLHAMPSGSWRFWTNLAHYIEFGGRILNLLMTSIPRGSSRTELGRLISFFPNLARLLFHYAIPSRHGEVGNSVSEIWTFSRRWWLSQFELHNFAVENASGMKLFYTGHMILAGYLNLPYREILSRVLGSACILYRVKPKR